MRNLNKMEPVVSECATLTSEMTSFFSDRNVLFCGPFHVYELSQTKIVSRMKANRKSFETYAKLLNFGHEKRHRAPSMLALFSAFNY
jgi:hypothetical protein